MYFLYNTTLKVVLGALVACVQSSIQAYITLNGQLPRAMLSYELVYKWTITLYITIYIRIYISSLCECDIASLCECDIASLWQAWIVTSVNLLVNFNERNRNRTGTCI